MRDRFLTALTVAAALAAAGTVLPSSIAVAGVDCTPTIDQHSIHFTPATSAVTSKGSTEIAVTATLHAPCGRSDAGDLFVEAGLTPVDFEHNLEWTVSSDVVPAGAHTYHLATSVRVQATKIDDVDAPRWDGYLGVVDTDDPGEWDLTTYSDPVAVIIRRAAKVTGNAAPEPVKKGKTLTVTGTLTRADWDAGYDRRYADQQVELQFRTPAGTYATVKKVHSSATGGVKAMVTAEKSGYYRFVFPGTSTTARASSTGDYVKVS